MACMIVTPRNFFAGRSVCRKFFRIQAPPPPGQSYIPPCIWAVTWFREILKEEWFKCYLGISVAQLMKAIEHHRIG
jgi:hypothetical protein